MIGIRLASYHRASREAPGRGPAKRGTRQSLSRVANRVDRFVGEPLHAVHV